MKPRRIVSGDTIDFSRGEITSIRIVGIDAPEPGQPLSSEAKVRLERLCLSRDCEVTTQGTDPTGMTLGVVTVNGQLAAKVMLTEGLAWHYVRYNHDHQLALAQASAMKGQRGVWSSDRSIPPWDWRQEHGEESPPSGSMEEQESKGFSCINVKFTEDVVIGEIRNETGKAISAGFFSLSLYDRQGALAEVVTIPLNDFSIGETKSFQALHQHGLPPGGRYKFSPDTIIPKR